MGHVRMTVPGVLSDRVAVTTPAVRAGPGDDGDKTVSVAHAAPSPDDRPEQPLDG